MLRLQSLVNASDTLCACSIGRRKALKSIDNACNGIFRTHVTINKKDSVLLSIPSTITSQYSTNRFIFQNSNLLKVLCVKKFHTQKIPQCQAGKTEPTHNNIFKTLLKEDEEDISNEGNKHRSEKQIFHKQLAFHNEILKEFPAPTHSLHNIYSIIQSQLKMEEPLILRFTESKHGWTCKCSVLWPEEKEFIASASSKKTAGSVVSLQCLHWLKDTKKLKNGLPVVFDVKKINASLNHPSFIAISKDSQLKIDNLLNEYDTKIQPILLKDTLPKFNELQEFNEEETFFGSGVFSQLNDRNIIAFPKIKPEVRNATLRSRLKERKPVGYDLPINAYRKQIIKLIEENQVVLIKGDTGCGKTTQVPQFIMDSFAERGEASKCNMLVTEPRRISAISLAERIAEERGEKIGDVIGYKVRLQHKVPCTPGAILFCTPGILLKKMQANPNLTGCSHVIIDEAHERKIDVDILLTLLRRIIAKNKDLKLIIMSATLNAEKFQNYFNCVSLDVPGRLYPVRMHFMDEISRIIDVRKHLEIENMRNPQVNCEDVASMVQWLSDNKPEGAILCFLPGWTEIVQVETLLKQMNRRNTRQLVLPLHSQLSYNDQQKIFEKPPIGVRKIILSTDIAETGITVRDVVYVVDSATHKETRWDKIKEADIMQCYRISQSNLLQRKGRAGRVQAGESYHFISKKEYQNMKQFPEPEVQCVSLERVVLDCKLCVNDKIEDFLSELPDPPDLQVVRSSVQNLISLGALDTDEGLTVLGKKIGDLSLPPVLGKTVIYSSIFGCLDPILTIASIFAMNMEIFINAMVRKEEIRSVKQRFDDSSDHLALAWIFMQWEAYLLENQNLAEQFTDECGLYHFRLFTLKKQRQQYLKQLSEMMKVREYSLNSDHAFNKYAQSDELIKAVLVSGVNNFLKRVQFTKRRDRIVRSDKEFIDEIKRSSQLTPESVNYMKGSFPSPFLTYVRKTFSGDRRKMVVRDSSIISPLTILLFAQGHLFGYERTEKLPYEDNNVSRKNQILMKFSDMDNISLLCNEKNADTLFRLRDCLWDVVRYLINNQGLPFGTQCRQLSTVDKFKDEMLSVIEQLLIEDSEFTKKNSSKTGKPDFVKEREQDHQFSFTEPMERIPIYNNYDDDRM